MGTTAAHISTHRKRWLRFRPLCEYLGITEALGRKAIRRGELVPYRIGKVLLFDLDAVEATLQERREQAKAVTQ